mmetsp:Transcript_45576/g.143135  ORF Transcript_45576/g.143135 Transcript_45576/m.143135 type:complete len:244 (-) Transcript_45576:2295-3026(-)
MQAVHFSLVHSDSVNLLAAIDVPQLHHARLVCCRQDATGGQASDRRQRLLVPYQRLEELRHLSLRDENLRLVPQGLVDVARAFHDELLYARDLHGVGVDGVSELLEHAGGQVLFTRHPRALPCASDARVRALDEVVGTSDREVRGLEVMGQRCAAVQASYLFEMFYERGAIESNPQPGLDLDALIRRADFQHVPVLVNLLVRERVGLEHRVRYSLVHTMVVILEVKSQPVPGVHVAPVELLVL